MTSLTLLTALDVSTDPASAQEAVINREYVIKAAFLYHFLSYVEWPHESESEAKQPFVIGVFEIDPFGNALDSLAEKKTVGDRSIEIRRLSSNDKASDCHIVFVPRAVPVQAQSELLHSLKQSHVLTVGETEDFIDRGGVAQFYLEGNKVRFAFNVELIQHSSLKVSSKLLGLAKIVSSE